MFNQAQFNLTPFNTGEGKQQIYAGAVLAEYLQASVSRSRVGDIVQPDSFAFGGVDMLKAYGVRCVSHDVLLPRLRPRKVTVPGRDGEYDFGAKRYEERRIRLTCDSMRALSRGALRELAELLSQKGRLVLWDEPNRYYVGRLYDEAQLQYIGMAGHAFDLTFACEPFAYGLDVDTAIGAQVSYRGTAESPGRLVLTNTGSTAVSNIRIRIRTHM